MPDKQSDLVQQTMSEFNLSESLPEELKSSLPTVEEIEKNLER